MCVHSRELEDARLHQRLTLAQYRPVERLTAHCEACPADCRCCDVMERVTPAEERRDGDRP